MKSLVLRSVVVLVAIGSWVGAGYMVWDLEGRAGAERTAADTFERQARQAVVSLADLRGALQAYVADGQNSQVWEQTAARMLDASAAQVRSLREAARSPEGQGAVEGAVEQVAGIRRSEARAREYLATSQRLSASDVLFAEASPQAQKAADALDLARGQESIASATALEQIRIQQLSFAGGAAGVSLLALLLLLPVPRRPAAASDETEDDVPADRGSSLGISHVAPTPKRAAPPEDDVVAALSAIDAIQQAGPLPAPVDLQAASDLCTALARVQEPRELPALLDRAAAVLNAAGLVIWMPDGPGGHLRPTLAHGYPPVVITRMGTIAADADNATAVAFRTQVLQTVPAEGTAPGAVAAPLITADGCSGVMAAELRAGSPATDVRAIAAIIAAQLATLISPAAAAGAGTGRE
jgi:hypothetical protein